MIVGDVEHRIARLMEEVAPSGVTWPQLFLGGVLNHDYGDTKIRFTEADKRHFDLNGISLEKYLTGLVFEGLPIESSTEGGSSVRLSFAVDNDYVLNFVGTGTFDTSYSYNHECADPDEEEPSDSQVNCEMTFTVDLVNCPPSDTKQ